MNNRKSAEKFKKREGSGHHTKYLIAYENIAINSLIARSRIVTLKAILSHGHVCILEKVTGLSQPPRIVRPV